MNAAQLFEVPHRTFERRHPCPSWATRLSADDVREISSPARWCRNRSSPALFGTAQVPAQPKA